MKSFKVPNRDAEAELVEKKSRFISRIYKIESAQQANDIIKECQKKYWDASHNVYAYVLENGVMRFSDDGEPQGTAGMPTLEVLKKEEVFNVLCVTTRYFGGVLLGAGGLIRAYGKSAKLALDAAEIAIMQSFTEFEMRCDYALLEGVRKMYSAFDAVETSADFEASVVIYGCLPSEKIQDFFAHVVDKTNGTIYPKQLNEKMFAKKL